MHDLCMYLLTINFTVAVIIIGGSCSMLINTHPSKVYVPPTRNMPDRIEKRNPILGSFKRKDAAIINLHHNNLNSCADKVHTIVQLWPLNTVVS